MRLLLQVKKLDGAGENVVRKSLNAAQHRRLRVIDTDQHKIRQQLGWNEASVFAPRCCYNDLNVL